MQETLNRIILSLQPPKYLIITVNIFNYINDIAMKNTSGSEHNASSLQFSLQATVGHHGNYMHRGHYYFCQPLW